MSEDMRNWRPFLSSATNKLNNFKGYLTSKDPRPIATPSPPTSFQQDYGDPSSPGIDPGSATRQSWRQWAGEKLRRNGQAQGNNANVVERVSLFPGWAARRLHKPSPSEGTRSLRILNPVFLNAFVIDPHFDAEIYVAGFASKLNNPESMSRSQRAFIRLAKGAHWSL